MIQEKFAYIIPLEEIYVPSDGVERSVKPLITLKLQNKQSESVRFKFMVALTGVRLSKNYYLLISVRDITELGNVVLVNTGELKHFETKENDLGFCTLVNQIELEPVIINKSSLYQVNFKLYDSAELHDVLDDYQVLLNAEVGE
ncbi:hypothetical protein HBA43_21170 [Providencia rettgeri]|uniref:Uncharacterized protein n=1 Tax=Providencia stuartii TaxID=588 RepID=A0A1S1HLP2_PROST|nr:hypothetical protein [Providencia rettgeri]OHT23175.1 hypothetical protein A3Q29_07030 [Providencia stuartii]NIA76651.1 hypothetical protein [Providencia rettgeri]NIA80892.1 hypothetical protein [Providencia rettgeri]NIB04125.1 hypothetical protein [Providencia rettgeri]NIB08328.1 hypothetical protein [Providencia rettgeri]